MSGLNKYWKEDDTETFQSGCGMKDWDLAAWLLVLKEQAREECTGLLLWEGVAHNLTSEDQVALIWDFCSFLNLPTCQSVKFSMSIAVYSITMCYPGAVEVCHGSLKNMIVQESAVESGQIILHNVQGNFLFSDNTSRYAMSLRFSMFTFHYKGT